MVSLHKLGDTVFSFPAVSYLSSIYGDNLIIVCYPESASIYRKKFNLNLLELSTNSFFFNGKIAAPSIRSKLFSIKPAIIIDITGELRSFSLILGNNAEIRGLEHNKLSGIYDYPSEKRIDCHLSEMYLYAAEPKLTRKEIENYKFIEFRAPVNNKILIHPFAGWKAKEWGLYRFISLAEKLSSDYEVELIFPAGQIEPDIKEYLIQNNLEFVETDSVGQLLEVVNGADYFIGCDSGPLYFAAMFGIPTFTIYGPTNPFYSLPEGSHHDFINLSLKCSPPSQEQYCITFAGREGCPSFECMNLLGVENVYNKFISFLEKFRGE